MKPGKMPSHVLAYRTVAKRFLPQFAYAYLEEGAEYGEAMLRNRQAFSDVLFEPKVLVDVDVCQTGKQVCGASLAFPAIVGPTGLNGLYRPKAEEHLARAAHRAGVPFVLSTASTSLIESVRAASDGDLWLQLYVQHDRSIAQSIMARAQSQGFRVLMLTVDTPVSGIRDHYARTGFTLPFRWSPRILWDVLTHPRWCWQTGRHGIPQLVNLAKSAGQRPDIARQAAALSRQMDTSLRWADIRWLRDHWQGPILIKGIQTVADALRAQQCGVDGVVLSNHGGRQLESVRAPLQLLPEVADAVQEGFTILIDGGIRRGSDVAKAMALGADAVLLGRAPLYGLAARGQAGVEDVLSLLRNELEVCLRLIGCPDIRDLGLDCVFGRGRKATGEMLGAGISAASVGTPGGTPW